MTVELLAVYSSLIILAFVNPIALDRIGWRYYIFFCCFDVLVLVVTWFCFPETKGHSLEEIAEVFDGPDFDVDEEKVGKRGVKHAEYVN